MAHLLTTCRLVLALPVAIGLAHPMFLSPVTLSVLLGLAVATDYLDGRVARATATASANGQLFDHATDCIFVTAGLASAAAAGLVTPILPVCVALAFSQYVFDSYVLHHRKQLRMTPIGRWNGIFYFSPLFMISASRLMVFERSAIFLTETASTAAYILIITTAVSVVDRAAAPVTPS